MFALKLSHIHIYIYIRLKRVNLVYFHVRTYLTSVLMTLSEETYYSNP